MIQWYWVSAIAVVVFFIAYFLGRYDNNQDTLDGFEAVDNEFDEETLEEWTPIVQALGQRNEFNEHATVYVKITGHHNFRKDAARSYEITSKLYVDLARLKSNKDKMVQEDYLDTLGI